MKEKSESQTNNNQSKQQDDSPLASAWDSAQVWMKEHKVITAIATVAVLYLLGGRRIKQIANFAVKSGVTAGIANAAMGTIMPQSKTESQQQDDYMYH